MLLSIGMVSSDDEAGSQVEQGRVAIEGNYSSSGSGDSSKRSAVGMKRALDSEASSYYVK